MPRNARSAASSTPKSPGFALLALSMMALGIGANTAVFSVVHAVLLKRLPYNDPEQIVTLSTSVGGRENGPIGGQIANADFEDWHILANSFDVSAYFAARSTTAMVGDQAEYARVARVSSDFFRVFGVQPRAGRMFDTAEIAAGRAAAAIVSAAFAEAHFGASHSAIGRTIRLYDRPCPIVGVVPPGFTFPERTEIWTPMPRADQGNPLERGGANFRAVARLKSGVGLERAQAEMTAIAQQSNARTRQSDGREF